jgi:hypothetical protein
MTEKSNNQQNKDFTESSRRGGRKYFSHIKNIVKIYILKNKLDQENFFLG